jgi:hypothetical protein
VSPVAGRTEVAIPISGVVLVRAPGQQQFTALRGTSVVADGTEIDATNGVVELVVASGPGGKTDRVLVGSGRFIVHQDAKTFFTSLSLSAPLACAARRARAAHAAAKQRSRRSKKARRSRRLWVSDTHGRFGTRGRYVATTVEGTRWLTSDTCTSSRVFVAQGTVKVADLVRHRTVTLHAGQSYTAKRHKRRH